MILLISDNFLSSRKSLSWGARISPYSDMIPLCPQLSSSIKYFSSAVIFSKTFFHWSIEMISSLFPCIMRIGSSMSEMFSVETKLSGRKNNFWGANQKFSLQSQYRELKVAAKTSLSKSLSFAHSRDTPDQILNHHTIIPLSCIHFVSCICWKNSSDAATTFWK